MEITQEQRDNMEHCLGLNRKKLPYRNYFCTYENDPEWEDLIKKGLASRTISFQGKQKYFYYNVTKEGQEFIGLKCECSELGCQNKFYKESNLTIVKKVPLCRKHYYMYR